MDSGDSQYIIKPKTRYNSKLTYFCICVKSFPYLIQADLKSFLSSSVQKERPFIININNYKITLVRG